MDVSEEEQVEMDAGDAVTKIPRQKPFSNELEEKAHTEHVEVSRSINPQLNEVLTSTTGYFREIRKVRGEAKNQEPPFHGVVPKDNDDEVEELVSVPTAIPNWITVEKYTPMLFDDGPHGPHSLAPTYTTHSISTPTGNMLKQSTKKRAPKRKPVLAQSPTTTTTSADPTAATPLVEDAVSMEMLKPEGATTLQAASEEHVGGVVENKPNSKKIMQSHGIEGAVCLLRIQSFIVVYKAQ